MNDGICDWSQYNYIVLLKYSRFLKRYTPRLNFKQDILSVAQIKLTTLEVVRLLGDWTQFVSERGMGGQNKAKLSRKESDILPSNDGDKWR